MAEEITNLPVTPNMTKLDGNNSRRNSTGKTVCAKSGEQILPHYLRASTGSCHDFCKYGRAHAFETKARHPMPRRVTKKANDKQILVEVEVAPVRKKASTAKIKQSSGSNTRSPNNTPNEQQVMRKSIDSPNSVTSNVLGERKKISGSKLKTSPSPIRPHENMKQKVSVESVSTEKMKISSKKNSLKAEEKPVSDKSSSSLKPNSLAKKLVSSLESSGGLNRNNSVKIIGKRTGTSKLALKKVSVLPKVLLSPRPSLSTVASLNARKHQSLKKVGSLINQNEIKKSEFKQSNSDEAQHPMSGEAQQPMSDEVQNSFDVQEKTLYVIKMETENRCFESDRNEICADESLLPPSSSSSSSPLPELSSVPSVPYCSSTEEEDVEESEYTASESEDETFSVDSELERADNTESQVGDEERKLRKSGVVYTEEKDSQNLKLKFRRGKEVDIQSENNSPRRLKFRRGRVLGDYQNVKEYVWRRNFKRRGGATDKSCESAPEKVVLRHQDVQGKMDAQGLFNNVIEETASKLAETRKSKVKALVGAFETVISLQDKKPAANNVA